MQSSSANAAVLKGKKQKNATHLISPPYVKAAAARANRLSVGPANFAKIIDLIGLGLGDATPVMAPLALVGHTPNSSRLDQRRGRKLRLARLYPDNRSLLP